MKVGFVSLGCPKNLVDSEVMLGLTREAGHTLTADPAAATRPSSARIAASASAVYFARSPS